MLYRFEIIWHWFSFIHLRHWKSDELNRWILFHWLNKPIISAWVNCLFSSKYYDHRNITDQHHDGFAGCAFIFPHEKEKQGYQDPKKLHRYFRRPLCRKWTRLPGGNTPRQALCLRLAFRVKINTAPRHQPGAFVCHRFLNFIALSVDICLKNCILGVYNHVLNRQPELY